MVYVYDETHVQNFWCMSIIFLEIVHSMFHWYVEFQKINPLYGVETPSYPNYEMGFQPQIELVLDEISTPDSRSAISMRNSLYGVSTRLALRWDEVYTLVDYFTGSGSHSRPVFFKANKKNTI